MSRLMELLLILAVSVVIAIPVIGFYQSRVEAMALKQMKIDSKLRSYELETERKRAEAMLIYAKALELSCAAELVNEFGEIYTRD